MNEREMSFIFIAINTLYIYRWLVFSEFLKPVRVLLYIWNDEQALKSGILALFILMEQLEAGQSSEPLPSESVSAQDFPDWGPSLTQTPLASRSPVINK